jgi:hypothetical protein
MFFKKRMNDAPLNPFPSAVNEANLTKTRFAAFFEIVFHHAWDIFRRKVVQIDGVFDGKKNRLAKGGIIGIFRFSAHHEDEASGLDSQAVEPFGVAVQKGLAVGVG